MVLQPNASTQPVQHLLRHHWTGAGAHAHGATEWNGSAHAATLLRLHGMEAESSVLGATTKVLLAPILLLDGPQVQSWCYAAALLEHSAVFRATCASQRNWGN